MDIAQLDDAFWNQAFDPRADCYDELRTEFRRGLVTGSGADLNWARLGLHDVSLGALWLVLTALFRHAIRANGKGQFVEALALYIYNPTSAVHGPDGARRWSDDQRAELAAASSELAAVLAIRRDDDMAAWLTAFSRNLAAGKQPVSSG